MNWFDLAIAAVAPGIGRRRAHDRRLFEMEKRTYQGGTKGRRGDGWRKTGTNGSADASSSRDLPSLIARSRDDIRNNGYIERAIRVIETDTIGTGIIPSAVGSAGKAKRYEELLTAWGDTEACDYDGLHDYYGLQSLIMRAVASDGGCLVRKRMRKMSDGLPVPMQLQLLEIDYLDTTKNLIGNGGARIVRGVEIDARGIPQAYWLFNDHPGAIATIGNMRDGWVSKRVPADEILHIYRVDRIGQLIGVPWGAPVMLTSRDLDDFEDAELMRQKIAACYTAFVRDIEMPDTLTTAEIKEFSKIEPGAVELLPPGKDVTIAVPPTGSPETHAIRAVRKIAIGFGLTYEAVSGDYSRVNFSSARMGWMQMQRNLVSWRNKMLIPRFCRPTANWMAEAAELAGVASGPIFWNWTSPRREMIDPVKETEATKSQMSAGLLSWSEAVRENGRDPDLVIAEIEKERKMFASKGISFDYLEEAQKAAVPAKKPPEEEDEDKPDQ